VVKSQGQQYNGFMVFLILLGATPVTATAASGTVDWSAARVDAVTSGGAGLGN
jgi:hypothetical protein